MSLLLLFLGFGVDGVGGGVSAVLARLRFVASFDLERLFFDFFVVLFLFLFLVLGSMRGVVGFFLGVNFIKSELLMWFFRNNKFFDSRYMFEESIVSSARWSIMWCKLWLLVWRVKSNNVLVFVVIKMWFFDIIDVWVLFNVIFNL